MKYAMFGMMSLFFSGFAPGCGGQGDRADEGENQPAISTVAQGLSGDPRTRMVQEASYAMWGNHDAYNATYWPEGTVYAKSAYAANDPGAWNFLVNSSGYGPNGYYVSCVGNYSPCYLTYGAKSPYYACQGYCPARVYHGGQCKAFTNLVAYRSGIYQQSGYGFKSFPDDGRIDSMPLVTHASVQAGDILRRTKSTGSPHSVIVVKRLGWPRILVVDSNWIDGPGNEIVGSHEMRFDDTNPVRNPGTYHVLNCVYDKSC